MKHVDGCKGLYTPGCFFARFSVFRDVFSVFKTNQFSLDGADIRCRLMNLQVRKEK